MDVKHINAFIDSTVNVIKTMAFVDPIAGKPYVKTDNTAHGDVTGIIGLTGSMRGSLAVTFTEGCIRKIVSNMLGEEFTSITDEIKDAVGEITNMISGDARKRLQYEGLTITAAIPTVVSGKGHVISHVLSGPSVIIPFSTDNGSFVVDVCIV
ncbi:MAG: chemotaxis protein CheX [Deltaproteobacteria bacterium]|nr:MAG: chemotaxis protein CheX [Deltaproteobacteria bacterium]